MSLTLHARASAMSAGAVPSGGAPDAGPEPGATKGRRRAESRHRRTRSSTLPAPLAILLRFGLPGFVLLALTAAQASAFVFGPESGGTLPGPLTLAAVCLLPIVLVVAARRMGISMLGALAAAVFAALAPASLQAAGVGYAEHLAVLALLAAAAVGAKPYRAPRSRILASGAVGALSACALMAAPLGIAAFPFLGWQLLRSVRAARRGSGSRMLLAAGLAAAAVLALSLALGIVQPADGDASAFGALREWVPLDPVRLAVGLAALAATLSAGRLRPLALAVLGLLAFAQLPGLIDPLAALVLVAPGMALLTGAAVDRCLVALGGRDRRPRLVGVAGVAVAGMALLVLTGTWGAALGERVASAGATSALPDAESPAAPVPSDQPAPNPASADPTGAAADREGRALRAEYGRQLLENPRLDPSPAAAELLADGAVDRRIAIVLGQLLADHDLTVADFPALDEEGPRRQLLVTAMDGEALAAGGASIPTLSAYLSGLIGEFAVESVTVDGQGVLATFPAAQTDNE